MYSSQTLTLISVYITRSHLFFPFYFLSPCCSLFPLIECVLPRAHWDVDLRCSAVTFLFLLLLYCHRSLVRYCGGSGGLSTLMHRSYFFPMSLVEKVIFCLSGTISQLWHIELSWYECNSTEPFRSGFHVKALMRKSCLYFLCISLRLITGLVSEPQGFCWGKKNIFFFRCITMWWLKLPISRWSVSYSFTAVSTISILHLGHLPAVSLSLSRCVSVWVWIVRLETDRCAGLRAKPPTSCIPRLRQIPTATLSDRNTCLTVCVQAIQRCTLLVAYHLAWFSSPFSSVSSPSAPLLPDPPSAQPPPFCWYSVQFYPQLVVLRTTSHRPSPCTPTILLFPCSLPAQIAFLKLSSSPVSAFLYTALGFNSLDTKVPKVPILTLLWMIIINILLTVWHTAVC